MHFFITSIPMLQYTIWEVGTFISEEKILWCLENISIHVMKNKRHSKMSVYIKNCEWFLKYFETFWIS